MPQNLLVERALALVPRTDEYLPLVDAIIGASALDRDKQWTRAGEYATISKRVVDTSALLAQLPDVVERARVRLQELFSLIIEAIHAQQSGDLAAAAEALIRAGEKEEAARWLDRAEQLYTLALQIAENLRDNGPQILALRRLGRASRAAGQLRRSWEFYERSYELAVAAMDLPGQVIACQGLGNLCDDRGQRTAAREWYERGLVLADGLDRPDIVWPFHTNLAALAIQDGALDAAELALARARATIEKAGAHGALIYWYNNQGLLAQARNNHPEAERVYREGLEHSRSPFWEVRLRINLGLSLVAQGRLFEAGEQARRTEEVAILHRLMPFLVDIYMLLGAIARAQADEDGFVFYEQALAVCREQDLPQVKQASVYHGYGMLLTACGRVPEAIAHLEHARELYRSLQLPVEEGQVTTDLDPLMSRVPAPETVEPAV